MRYFEYAKEPHLRNGTMIPVSSYPDLLRQEDTGYCSVFQFFEPAVLHVRAQGSSKGLNQFPVYADRLWMDFDAADTSEEQMKITKTKCATTAAILKSMNASFTIWFSGRKGYHICCKITPMSGHGVPLSHATFVKSLGAECDMSLYQHGRLFSNPGRVHKKTGVKKHLVSTHESSTLLAIPYIEFTPTLPRNEEQQTPVSMTQLVLSRAGIYLSNDELQTPGNRHTALWSIAMNAFSAGMGDNLVWELLQHLNRLSQAPKPIDELQLCLKQAKAQSR
jgi:hypothetical protein